MASYINRHNVIFSRKDIVMVIHPHERWLVPVEVQGATVDRPCEQGVVCESYTELLDGNATNIGHVKVQVRHQTLQGLVKASRRSFDFAEACRLAGAGYVVANDTSGVLRGIICNPSAGTDPQSPQPIVAWRSVGLNNDVISLGWIDDDAVGIVWLDRDKVIGYHLQFVAVNTEFELAIRGNVD